MKFKNCTRRIFSARRQARKNYKGFTIVELIIVITIVLILSSAAISGTAGLIKNLRFNNTFNKVIFMAQQARNMAVTGKSTGVTKYEVKFFGDKVTLSSTPSTSPPTNLNEITLGTDFSLTSAVPGATNNCSGGSGSADASISFSNGNAETALICGASTETKSLTVSLQETANTATGLIRSFSIYSASGIPQVK